TRVEQGRRTARTLYNAWQSEVTNAAILTTQLPTLRTLLETGNQDELAAYLQTVEASLNLDLVLTCDATNQIAAQVGEIALANACSLTEPVGFYIVPEPVGSPVWLLANQPILVNGQPAGHVLVGMRLDDAFATRMRGETNLQHTLLVDGTPVATSFSGGLAMRTAAAEEPATTTTEAQGYMTFALADGRSFYAARLSLENPRLTDEVALSATEIITTQRNLIRTGISSILIVIVLGSLIGLALARRISRPLLQLDQAAARIRAGQLDQAIGIQTDVREVARVAATLERTRIDLQQTLATLQQEKAWVDHLLESIVEGIMILDTNGRITYFSEGATRITGWANTEVQQRPADEVFQPLDNQKPFSQLIPAVGRRRTVHVKLAAEQPAALSMTRAELLPPEADTAQIAIVFRDISEEEAVQRLMRNFLTNITHEFRTPLTALSASVELLLDQADTLTPTEMEQMLNWLHLGILGLQTLIDNLIESASLEAGRFQVTRQPTDLAQILREATKLMRPLHQKYHQQLTLELPSAGLPTLSADARRLTQVIVNLLANAHKYAPAQSEIKLRAAVEAQQIKIEVADRGPGVPSDAKSKLFHRFLHINIDSDQKRFGVGLGLWVVKAIVEEHGGDVGVTDRAGGGSIFWFTLPYNDDNDAEESAV
ncbi:MAG: PAS domain-containing protein, partial [Anaerolineales bacterium]|nr:PAS domain-containing protein [Anaerolineales bacterium]